MEDALLARQEYEANSLACDLLMPRGPLRRALKNVDLMDFRQVEKVAKRFEVPGEMILWNVGRLQALRFSRSIPRRKP